MNRPPAAAALARSPSGATLAARWSPLRGVCWIAAVAALVGSAAARADAVDALRGFVRDVKSARATFTQTVTSADGKRRKTSSGEFEFLRPNRFRFAYTRPYAQLIVADGQKVWLHDPDLNQVSSRRIDQALGATPAALLAGAALEPDFVLSTEPSRDGVEWALAVPRAKDGAFQALRVGFRAGTLVAIEITDAFGQQSRLDFADFASGVALPAERFRFVPPSGTDVVEQ